MRFQETAFTMPWDANRQAIHNHVYEVLLEGQHVPNDRKTRSFVYSAEPMGAESGIGLISARAPVFGRGIQAQDHELTICQGETLALRITLSANRQHRTKINGREATAMRRVQDDELHGWLTDQILPRNGIIPSEITAIKRHEHKVFKPNMSFGMASVVFQARAQIIDSQLFAKAFLSGIGRQKGYGFGLIEVVER